MKNILFAISLFFTSIAWCTPSRYYDGQIQFATHTFDGDPVFTQWEYDLALSRNPSAVIVQQTPLAWEVNLSTCLVVNLADDELVIGWRNHTEFIACQTRKGLKRKIMRIRTAIDSMSDLPAVDSADLKNRSTWLKSYYLSLP